MALSNRIRVLADAAKPLVRAARTGGAEVRGGSRRFPIELDYPVRPTPRFGYDKPPHRELLEVIAADTDRYVERMQGFCDLKEALFAIPHGQPDDPSEPWWHNPWYGGLDAVALYGILATENPTRFIEIGSGNSTKFARRSITDHGLVTHVTSIDPHPRAEIDELCDVVIRQPLEDCDLSVFDAMRSGDVCFMDGSHRSFMNSDATVFFTEVVPRLPEGVFVHVHDCFLPWDYPPQIADWYWSEHYLLACWLLAGDRLQVVMPNFYISTNPELHHVLDPVFDRFTWSAAPTNGTGFWFRTTS